MASEILKCLDFRQPFMISDGEEKFLRATFPNYKPPKRCKDCRQKRKARVLGQPLVLLGRGGGK